MPVPIALARRARIAPLMAPFPIGPNALCKNGLFTISSY
jgi:hypothetical protein